MADTDREPQREELSIKTLDSDGGEPKVKMWYFRFRIEEPEVRLLSVDGTDRREFIMVLYGNDPTPLINVAKALKYAAEDASDPEKYGL